MIKFKAFLSILLLISYLNPLTAETYYISNSGNDANNGLSPFNPIKSIEKLNSLILKLTPGDVVLFERGSTFNGQITMNATGDNTNPVTFAAYGKGKNPIISGSAPVSNWSIYKGEVFKTFANSEVKDLFANEDRMILARYPNSGYLNIDKPYSEPKKGFTDSELSQSEGYWNGSNVRIRTENWAYEYTTIQGFKNGSISFTNPTYYSAKSGWGYYLDNNLNQLDIENEWYFDKNNNSKNENLYFYPPKGFDPNESIMHATVSDYGFFSVPDITNVIIKNLEFRNQYLAGIYFDKKISKLKVENCTFSGQSQIGIFIPGQSENIVINNCRFYNITGKALYILNSNNSIISNNIFRNTGMIPGYGTTGDPFPMSAIFVYGNKNRITGNNIDGVGHIGINCIGSQNIIEKNVIKNSLLLLNDGGAIKCYGEASNNSEWKDNFIFNVPGNMEATDKKYNQIIALGFYFDELANNNSVSHNTIAGCAFAGIGTNAGFDNTFENNIFYGNSIGITFYQNEIPCKNNNFNNNILFGNNENQYAIMNQSLYSSTVPGRFDNNYYINPVNYNIFRIMENNIISDYNFEKWKRFVKSDNNSDLIVRKDASNSKLFTNMSDDSITILLNNNIGYKNVYSTRISGSLVLAPWSSEILIANSDINRQPELNIAGGVLKYTYDNNVDSEVQWFNLIGENLQYPVFISAPAGFEISLKEDIGFSNSIKIDPLNGKVDNIIFVKFLGSNNKMYFDFILNKSDNIIVNKKVTGY